MLPLCCQFDERVGAAFHVAKAATHAHVDAAELDIGHVRGLGGFSAVTVGRLLYVVCFDLPRGTEQRLKRGRIFQV